MTEPLRQPGPIDFSGLCAESWSKPVLWSTLGGGPGSLYSSSYWLEVDSRESYRIEYEGAWPWCGEGARRGTQVSHDTTSTSTSGRHSAWSLPCRGALQSRGGPSTCWAEPSSLWAPLDMDYPSCPLDLATQTVGTQQSPLPRCFTSILFMLLS